MARYTCLFTLAASVKSVQQRLKEMLEACNFDVIYQSEDYIMAREVPGQVTYAKLVVAEVLIDRTTATEDQVKMNFVIKNEELPLQVDNHCRQMFDQVSAAIAQNTHWKLIESVAG